VLVFLTEHVNTVTFKRHSPTCDTLLAHKCLFEVIFLWLSQDHKPPRATATSLFAPNGTSGALPRAWHVEITAPCRDVGIELGLGTRWP
jgi:hypothetical protein